MLPDAPDSELQNPEHITAFLKQVAGWVLRAEIAPSLALASLAS